MNPTVLVIIISLTFSAFFSGMEIAFVVSNKLRFEISKQKSKVTSSILSLFYAHPSKYISTILVGKAISLVVFAISTSELVMPYVALYFQSSLLIGLLQILFSAILFLIVAEFLPQILFKINPSFWLRIFAIPFFCVYVILYPILFVMHFLSIFIFKLFRISVVANEKEYELGRADLNGLLQENMDNLSTRDEMENEVKIFQNALDFSKIRLRDCIVPRTEILAVDFNESVDELTAKFVESGYSRILVYKGNIDNIVGYIHSVELFGKPKKWQDKIILVPIVPETMSASKLMNFFLLKKKSIAVVVDEFGGTSGIVTLEDIVEEIFGEIEDEHDVQEYVEKKINENEYVFSGRLEIDYVNEHFNLHLPTCDEYLTVAGFVLYYYQGFPRINEEIKVQNYILRVLKASLNKIELVKIKVDN